jgi:formylglycine-generating enzyme required for sulfatase activity
MYTNEVTVKQYAAFCAATSRAMPEFPVGYSWAGKTGWNDPLIQQHPIVNVSWSDCQAYAEWAGVSLPTEAQWEYAACGNQGNNYPWGGIAAINTPNNGWDSTKCANYFNSQSKNISTHPTGSFPSGASWCGVNDLAGNVFEWCSDWYSKYSLTPVTNPTGPVVGSFRVIRGGSWYDNSDYTGYSFRGTYRENGDPDDYTSYYGFRCVSNTTKD